jgi:hypothetical protein
MKFSLFGYTTGSSYSLSNLRVANATTLGFRIRYAVEGTSTVDVTFNGGTKTLANIGNDNVVDIKLSVPDVGEITVSPVLSVVSMTVSECRCSGFISLSECT